MDVSFTYGNFGQELGDAKGPKPSRNAERNAEIVRLAKEGGKVRDIAAKVDLKIARVYLIGKGHWKHARGNSAGQRVSEAGRAEICQKVIEGGRTLESIGNEYGITRERVRQIVRRSHPEYSRRGLHQARAAERRKREEADAALRKASREALIAQVKALIAGGMSKRAALLTLGYGGHAFLAEVKAITNTHGRWGRGDIEAMRAGFDADIAAGLSVDQIAEKYGISVSPVYRERKKRGLARSKG